MPSAKSSSLGHVAIFTFPFTSHPLPLFNLVHKLANAAPGVQFSFFSTEKCYNSSLLSTQKTALPANMKAFTYAMNTWEKTVPEEVNYDFLTDIDIEIMFFIKSMPENIKVNVDFAVAETGRSITCLLTDAFFSFAVEKLAEELKVHWLAFWVMAPYSLSAQIRMDLIEQLYVKCESDDDNDIPAYDKALESIPGLSVFRYRDMPPHVLTKYHGVQDSEEFLSLMRNIGPSLPKASAVIINSYEEVNSALVTNDLKSKFKDLLYSGFLTCSDINPSAAGATGCLAWLDGQKPASVAYVSFGTAVSLPGEELVALAEALATSGVPFLWSLADNFREDLPDGFLERTKMQGMVVPWAPQIQVLAHPSVGVHVSHCGYISICESILNGIPMIGRAGWADNHMNARMVEEVWGIGVRVEGGVITKNGMINCLEIIFQSKKGKKIRADMNALKEVAIKAAAPDGNASKDFKTLVQWVSKM